MLWQLLCLTLNVLLAILAFHVSAMRLLCPAAAARAPEAEEAPQPEPKAEAEDRAAEEAIVADAPPEAAAKAAEVSPADVVAKAPEAAPAEAPAPHQAPATLLTSQEVRFAPGLTPATIKAAGVGRRQSLGQPPRVRRRRLPEAVSRVLLRGGGPA